MKRNLLTMACLALAFGIGMADTSPLWLRNTALSPDGQNIAFTYMGDIYTVPFSGGSAHRVTTDAAYDTRPVWSPDGKKIAFASTRAGSQDIYIVDARGGNPLRLTTHSGTEAPLAFANDSTIIFSGNIMPSAQAINGYVFTQLYTVTANGGRPQLLLSLPSDALCIDAAGRILYQDKKGYEDKYRKHEHSSGTSDIWYIQGLFDGKPEFRQLTAQNYHSLNPQWNGIDKYLYVSEGDGTLNVYEGSLTAREPLRQLTHFKDHPVRSLTVANNGNIAFSQDGRIYTMHDGSEPKPLEVNILSDNPERAIERVQRTRGASNIALSPNGDEIAFIVRGNVYVTSVKYNTTRQITATPEQERIVEFTPDGRSLIYDSERDGVWQLYQTTIADPKEKRFTYATSWTEKPLTSGRHTSFQPRVSPDGKKVAYLYDRTTLKILDLATGKDITAMDGKYAYSYTDGDLDMTWSPDSKWLLFQGYIGKGGWNNSDVALIKADGTEVIDLTESGYTDSNPKWTADGRGILFQSDRNGYRSHGSWGSEDDVYVMWLDPEAYRKFRMTKEEREQAEAAQKDEPKKDKKGKKDKKAEPAAESKPFDLAARKDRRMRLTPNSSFMADYYLDKDGKKLYYTAAFEDDYDLWVMDLEEAEPSILKKGWGYGPLIPDSAGKKLFTVTSSGIKSIDLGTKEVKSVAYKAKDLYSAPQEREYMWDHMRALVANKFYDKNLHGVDWDKYTSEYGRFLPYINNKYDFAELLSEVLGELNASHTGGRAYGSISGLEATSYLGAFYDPKYTGDGLRISEIISRGPLATYPQIKVGDIVTAIDGEPIKAGEDYFPLFAGKARQNTRVTFRHNDGKTEIITLRPVSQGKNRDLLYERWKDRNRHIVDSISGGKVGYVHIAGMNSSSYREIYEQILGQFRNCDAIVVDTRYNGGGWLHNDVALLLSGHKYVDYSPRGQYIGSDPFSQWTKPSAMLINECNYSDAHGTPYVYKTLGIGKLVGAPVPGTMTAVWWESQVDPSIVFGVPQVTSLDLNGKPLENQQLNPDILILNQPGEVLDGIDRQLEGAVRALMQKK